MKYPADVLQRFIDEIREHGPDKGLTKWEADFVDSVAGQLDDRRRLSDRQVELLDRIYAERTS